MQSTPPLRVTFALLCIALTATLARAQYILNPKTYTSASGEYELFIDPSEREGVGPSTMTMSRNGEELWQREHPFSLWHASITDDGRTAGYCYIHGMQGSTLVLDRNVPNTLDIVFVDAKGDITARHPIPRQHSGMLSNPPSPLIPTVSLFTPVPAHDLLVIEPSRSWNNPSKPWWLYRLSTGEHLQDIADPSAPTIQGNGFSHTLGIVPIGDRPLLARHTQLNSYDIRKRTESAHLSVLDLEGNELWSHTITGEYDGLEDRWRWKDTDPREGQLTIAADGFQFHSWSTSELIRYACKPDGNTWIIEETGRVPAEFEPVEEQTVTLDTIKLELSGTINLGATPPARFGHIGNFDLDGAGNIGLIPWQQNPRSFILVSPQGEILHRHELPEVAKGERPEFSAAVWAGIAHKPDRWLFYRDGLGEQLPAAAWYDADTRTITPIPDLGMTRIEAMHATPDGGLVAMGEGKTRSRDGLVAFDSSGKAKWTKPLFSPNDLAVTTAGEIVVVDVIRHELLWFTADGTHDRTTDLDAAFGRTARYPTALAPDADGGVIVHDFSGSPPIYRVTRDGTATSSFKPAFEDGRSFQMRGDVARAPDGTLWTSDGHAFLELYGNGVVQRVVGEEPDERPLREIRALAIGPRGNIYAVNDANAAIHTFDRTGKPRRILPFGKVAPGVNGGPKNITIGHDGSIYGLASFTGGGVRYDRNGKPMPPLDGATQQIAESWFMQPNATVGWSVGYTHAALFEITKDNTTRIIRPIHRRPDNTWIERGNEAAVAEDGSLAMIASEDRMIGWGTPTLCIYGPDGEPLRTYAMHGQHASAQIAFIAPYVVTMNSMTDPHAAYLYDVRTDAPPRRIAFPEQVKLQDHWWYVHPSPHPGEFLMRASDSLELLRITLPVEPEPHK